MHFNQIKFISLLFVCSLVSCASSVTSETIYPFSTYLTMTFYNENNVDTTYIKELINNYDQLADPYNTYDGVTNICSINDATDYVEVNDTLLELLKYSVSMKENTNGYFNPLIGNLSLTWKVAIENSLVPTDLLIQKELNEINTSTILFDGNKVKIDGDANIDLGAVTKGYVLSKISDYLYEKAITKYLINAGNSSIILGNKNGDYFNVGINSLSAGFKAKDCALGTSSIDEQQFVIDGVTYSHIINPFTGSAIAAHETVVVMGTDAALLDVYSTVFMMLSVEDIKTIAAANNFEIIVVDDKNITYKSEGIELYV